MESMAIRFARIFLGPGPEPEVVVGVIPLQLETH